MCLFQVRQGVSFFFNNWDTGNLIHTLKSLKRRLLAPSGSEYAKTYIILLLKFVYTQMWSYLSPMTADQSRVTDMEPSVLQV